MKRNHGKNASHISELLVDMTYKTAAVIHKALTRHREKNPDQALAEASRLVALALTKQLGRKFGPLDLITAVNTVNKKQKQSDATNKLSA